MNIYRFCVPVLNFSRAEVWTFEKYLMARLASDAIPSALHERWRSGYFMIYHSGPAEHTTAGVHAAGVQPLNVRIAVYRGGENFLLTS